MSWLHNDNVVFALIAFAIFAVYMGVVGLVRKNQMKERLKSIMPVDEPGVGFSYEENKTGFSQFCENLLYTMGADIGKAKRELYLPMARAGLMSNRAVVYLLFFRRLAQPVLCVIALLIFWRMLALPDGLGPKKLFLLLLAVIFAVAGLFGTKLYLSNRTKKRQAVLQKSFSDALDLLLVCVESGLPLDGALARVTRELKTAHPEITAELDRTRIELSVLNDRAQALTNLSERTDTPAFKIFVASLIQSEKYGTSIADTLRSMADEFRINRMLNAENRAARIPALITLPLILFILPAFMLIIMGPPIIRVQQQGGLFGPSNGGK